MKLVRTLLVLSLFCLLGASTQAQVLISLTPSSTQPLLPGGTLTFSGTIMNTGPDVFINGDEIVLTPPDNFSIDDTPLLTAAQLFPLPAGASFTGTLFSLTAPKPNLHTFYSGTLTLLGGADSFSSDPVGSVSFRFNAVPEPGALALLMGGSVAGIGFLMRRRKR